MTGSNRAVERVILVGTGGFGESWLLAFHQYADQLEVVGVAEPDDAARTRAARAFGLSEEHQASATSEEFMASLGPTVVIDSSPFPFRRQHALAAFRAGADVLAAKPMGRDLKDARSIVAAADDAGRSIAVAQQMRYFPCFIILRNLVRDGVLGKVRSAHVTMALDGRGWQPGTSWRLVLPQPLLQEAAIHHFDLMRWCLDDEFRIEALAAWNPPWSPFSGSGTVSAILRSDRGTPVTYDATFAPGPDEATVRFDSGWRLVLDDGVITVRDGGVYVDRELHEGSSPTDEPVPLEDLNATLLGVWLKERADGGAAPFGGHDNLHSMGLLDDALAWADA